MGVSPGIPAPRRQLSAKPRNVSSNRIVGGQDWGGKRQYFLGRDMIAFFESIQSETQSKSQSVTEATGAKHA